MSRTRMIVSPSLLSELCPFDFFTFFPKILVRSITHELFGIISLNFIGMYIRSRRCVAYNNCCSHFLRFRVMALWLFLYLQCVIYILVHSPSHSLFMKSSKCVLGKDDVSRKNNCSPFFSFQFMPL